MYIATHQEMVTEKNPQSQGKIIEFKVNVALH